MRTIYAEYNIKHDSIDVYTSVGYMLRIDCWEAEKDLKTTYGSECALTSVAVDEPLEYARLYLDGNLQMWVDAEDSLELQNKNNGQKTSDAYFTRVSEVSLCLMVLFF